MIVFTLTLVVYSSDRSKAMVPVLVSLLLCGLFYEVICFMSYLFSYFFLPLVILFECF